MPVIACQGSVIELKGLRRTHISTAASPLGIRGFASPVALQFARHASTAKPPFVDPVAMKLRERSHFGAELPLSGIRSQELECGSATFHPLSPFCTTEPQISSCNLMPSSHPLPSTGNASHCHIPRLQLTVSPSSTSDSQPLQLIYRSSAPHSPPWPRIDQQTPPIRLPLQALQ